MTDDVQATIHRLEQELAQLKATVDEHPSQPTTRRGMLRTVAAGAAGAAVAGVAGLTRVGPAAAADPQDLDLGETNTNGGRTRTIYTGGPTPVATGFTIESGPNTANNNDGIISGVTANQGTALLGVANEDGSQGVGTIGWSKKPGGIGLIGFTGGAGKYGAEVFGGQADLRIRPGGTAPVAGTPVAHDVGELIEDQDGVLWVSVAAGTPGEWRVLASPTSAGAFHAISPSRVYDSRLPGAGGKLADGLDRVVQVHTSNGTEIIPPGTTAVAITLTITLTEGAAGGFLAVRPEGTPYQGTSSINWFAPDQNLATTVISGVGANGEITVRGGVAPTHFVVDVTGFYR